MKKEVSGSFSKLHGSIKKEVSGSNITWAYEERGFGFINYMGV